MKFVYLESEVRKIPPYKGRNPNHEGVLEFFQRHRDALYCAISSVQDLKNPFVSIDHALGVAGRLNPVKAEGHMKFVLGRMLSDLDHYARGVQERGRSGAGLATREYESAAYVATLEEKRRANHQRRLHILSEVEALQRLAFRYYNAQMARRRIEFALHF